MNAEKRERASNFELLRILAMLAIVAGHVFSQTDVATLYAHSPLVVFFGTMSMFSVDLFLFLGCWFMVDAEFKWSRIRTLYSTLISYTIPLTLLAVLCGASPALKDVARGFLPFTGRALWFASAYLSLLLLTPWLKAVFKLPRKSLGRLILVLTLLIPCVSTLPDAQNTYLCHFLWFPYVYILIGFLKKHVNLKFSRAAAWGLLLAGLSLHALMSLGYSLGPTCGKIGGVLSRLSFQYLNDFKTLPTFFIALLLFGFFLNLNIGSLRWINALARPAFAVYVIHQTPAFFPFLWKSICRVNEWASAPWFGWGFASTVLGLYLAGSLVESVRRLLLGRLRKTEPNA